MSKQGYSLLVLPFVMACRLWRKVQCSLVEPLKTRILSAVWRMECAGNVRFIGKTIIRCYDRNAISIGRNVMFVSCQNRNLVGLNGPTVLCASKGAKIEIGDDSGFSSPVINARSSIKIGCNVKVGGNVRIFDHDFHPLDWRDRRAPEKGENTRVKDVTIEDDVFIGTNSIILKGTHIGARSIVAAGSVVFGMDVPPDSLVKGNPAVVVKRKTVQDGRE